MASRQRCVRWIRWLGMVLLVLGSVNAAFAMHFVVHSRSERYAVTQPLVPVGELLGAFCRSSDPIIGGAILCVLATIADRLGSVAAERGQSLQDELNS